MKVEYHFNRFFIRVIESTCIKFVLETENKVITVEYPEAAVMDLISRYSTYDEIEPLLMAILGLGSHETFQMFHSAINKWVEAGILEVIYV